MSAKAKEAPTEAKLVAQNRRARFDYELLDTHEAGLTLTGTEVKSLREGRASLAEAHVGESGGELWLFNAHIPEFAPANRFNHEPRRPRKLLMHRREIQKEGMTIVPLRLYFNRRGIAKLALALARGKKRYDKRETEKKRDWQREKARLMKEKG
jgi:SsrA-binding protein